MTRAAPRTRTITLFSNLQIQYLTLPIGGPKQGGLILELDRPRVTLSTSHSHVGLTRDNCINRSTSISWH